MLSIILAVYFSHEVVVAFFCLGEASFGAVLFPVFVVGSAHDVVDHGRVVVSLVALATTSLEGSLGLLHVLVKLALFLNLVVVHQLEVIGNPLDAFGVTVLWHVFSNFLQEFLDVVGSVAIVESPAYLLCEIDVVFLVAQLDIWHSGVVSKELVGQASFSSLL
jgi:hypothetical protein